MNFNQLAIYICAYIFVHINIFRSASTPLNIIFFCPVHLAEIQFCNNFANNSFCVSAQKSKIKKPLYRVI